MKKILFKTEKDVKKENKCNYLTRNDIKNVDFEFKSMDKQHNIIKGSRGVGKTDKVLVPLFKDFSHLDNAILFIDFNNECEDKVLEVKDRIVHVFYNKDVNPTNVMNTLRDGEIVYFNVRPNKAKDIENLRKILKMLDQQESKLNKDVLVLIDNIQFMHRIPEFVDLLKDKTPSVFFTILLQYTRQLVPQYTEEEVEFIKSVSVSYDLEKQLK